MLPYPEGARKTDVLGFHNEGNVAIIMVDVFLAALGAHFLGFLFLFHNG